MSSGSRNCPSNGIRPSRSNRYRSSCIQSCLSSNNSNVAPRVNQNLGYLRSSFQQALEDEWDFCLGNEWATKLKCDEKMPHLDVPNAHKKVVFPVCSTETSLSEWAQFYQNVFDVEEKAGVDGKDGPYLYYLFNQCLEGQAMKEWNKIKTRRQTCPDAADRALTVDHLGEDIDSFMSFHKSCDVDKLKNNKITYVKKIMKPIDMSPTYFLNVMSRMNTLIAMVPGLDENNCFNDRALKNLLLHAMPKAWCKKFLEDGKRASTKSLDSIAAFFDFYHHTSDYGDTSCCSRSCSHCRHSRSHTSNSNGKQQQQQSEWLQEQEQSKSWTKL